MEKFSVILDTNVLVAASRSRNGASFALLEKVKEGKVAINLSVPLAFEYEAVLSRSMHSGYIQTTAEQVVDDLCQIALLHEVYFLWRPFLQDPNDDFVLELALKSGCDYIVTHNLKDFNGIEQFRINVVTPKELLLKIS